MRHELVGQALRGEKLGAAEGDKLLTMFGLKARRSPSSKWNCSTRPWQLSTRRWNAI